MKAFATRTTIRATAQSIWNLLVDGPMYPSWNRTVTRVDGKIGLGERLTIHATASPGRAFPVRVVAFEQPKRLGWSGGMPLGLFTGERIFELRELRSGAVEFEMHEAYSGLLAPLIGKSIPDLQPAFDEFAACLKTRAESDAAG